MYIYKGFLPWIFRVVVGLYKGFLPWIFRVVVGFYMAFRAVYPLNSVSVAYICITRGG